MTWYLLVRPSQEPYDSGKDPSGKYSTFTFDAVTLQEPSPDSLYEMGLLLEQAGVGIINESILFSKQAFVKTSPTIVLRDYGGQRDVSVQDRKSRRFQRLRTRLVAHATLSRDAKVMACDAYRALEVVRNREVTKE